MMGRSKSQERIPVKLRRQTVHQDTMQYLKVNFQHCLFPEISTLVTLLKWKDRLLCYTYLYENGMFTNKQDAALSGKENAQEAVFEQF